MGAEGREPSGEDRSWKLGDRRSEIGDRDALTRLVKFCTTAKRLHNKAQGRFSAPWVHVGITHSQPQSGCTTKPRVALAHPGCTFASRIHNRETVTQQSPGPL